MENRTVYCSTKRFEGDDAIRTKLIIDMSKVTETDLVEYAIDALIIKWQASIRRKKDAKIPTEATYIVPKPGTRAQATMSEEEMFAALLRKYTPEQFEQELRKRLREDEDGDE